MSYEKPNLKSKHFNNLFNNLPSMEGKTVAITGTTSGTGFVAAQACGKLGARVLLLNRPSTRADAALNDLQSQNSNADFTQIDCDLQSFSSVREAAKNLRALCPEGLDVLCNNAGVMALEDTATADGFDVQMQTNHLSHFLLTKNLYSLLNETAEKIGEARIVNHSSTARKIMKRLEGKYLEKKSGSLGGNGSMMIPFPGGRWKRYAQTKLANAAFTACLHERLRKSKSKVKALVAHPGLATTELQSTTVKDGGMNKWFTGQFMKGGQTSEDGSMGIIECMTKVDIECGSFYGPGSRMTSAKGKPIKFELEGFYDNDKTKKLLWEKSCNAIGEDFNI
jgi:NAD(P)-dependent dehydrogenase (short-subunit alcohol dehydrogenase family)